MLARDSLLQAARDRPDHGPRAAGLRDRRRSDARDPADRRDACRSSPTAARRSSRTSSCSRCCCSSLTARGEGRARERRRSSACSGSSCSCCSRCSCSSRRAGPCSTRSDLRDNPRNKRAAARARADQARGDHRRRRLRRSRARSRRRRRHLHAPLPAGLALRARGRLLVHHPGRAGPGAVATTRADRPGRRASRRSSTSSGAQEGAATTCAPTLDPQAQQVALDGARRAHRARSSRWSPRPARVRVDGLDPGLRPERPARPSAQARSTATRARRC